MLTNAIFHIRLHPKVQHTNALPSQKKRERMSKVRCAQPPKPKTKIKGGTKRTPSLSLYISLSICPSKPPFYIRKSTYHLCTVIGVKPPSIHLTYVRTNLACTHELPSPSSSSYMSCHVISCHIVSYHYLILTTPTQKKRPDRPDRPDRLHCMKVSAKEHVRTASRHECFSARPIFNFHVFFNFFFSLCIVNE